MKSSLEDLFKKSRSSEKRKNAQINTSDDNYPPDQSAAFLDNNGCIWSPCAPPPPPRPKRPKHSPRPDAAESSVVAPFIVTPSEGVTRVSGVVDLDEETVLSSTTTSIVVRTMAVTMTSQTTMTMTSRTTIRLFCSSRRITIRLFF
jgi:hypothetical protein